MRGHLEKRGKDVWRFKVYIGTLDGKRRYATKTFHGSQRQAETALHTFMVEVGAGQHDNTEGTVEDLCRRWLAVAQPSLSPTTAERYSWLIDNVIVPRLGSTKLRLLRPAHLDSMYADLLKSGGKRKGKKALSPATVHKVHRLIHRVLRQGLKWGWLTTNPASMATPPKVPRPQLEVPDAEDVLSLIGQLEEYDPDMAVLLRLAAATGIRRGELCALRWSDLDLVADTLVIARAVIGRSNGKVEERDTKTGNRRRIALDPDTVDVLARYRDRCDARAEKAGATIDDKAFIFSPVADGSRPWRPDGVSLALRRIRKHFGAQSGTLLSLRHFAATQLLAGGVDVRTVAGRLGHSNPTTTLSRYAEWLEAADQRAASKIGEILKVNAAP